MPTGNLPASGKKLFEEVYNTALKGSCKGDKGCAAASAWTAVKNAGWSKDKDGKWHKKSDVKEFSFAIVKASQDPRTGEKRWRAVASDTDTDSYNDNMTIELFNDFSNRIENEEPPPEEFKSDFWEGGMPYLSVSHYPDLNGKAVPGIADVIYIDGNRFKARGRFSDTPLGNICFDAVKKDLNDKNREDKIRISIAFLDYAHKHKSNGYVFERKELDDICPECIKEYVSGKKAGKYFMKGHLIHLALTRVPVNKRTSMEVERAMTTRLEDAASIIGDELADEIEEEAKLIGKSEALVIKADEEAISEEPIVEEAKVVTSDEQDEEEAEKEKKALNAKDEGNAVNNKAETEPEVEPVPEPVVEEAELVEEGVTKKEGDCAHPSSHYLVVEDSSKPTTWHLRVKNCSGAYDHRLMGAAWAALHGGYRGNKYAGGSKEAAISKLKGIYKREGMETPSKADIERMYGTEMPMEYRPYGGATSMKDAQKVLDAQEEKWRIDDLWRMLQEVVGNITSDVSIEDKGKTIAAALDEFKTLLATKSMVSFSIEKAELEHPLDAVIRQFKSDYDEAVALEDISSDDKLRLIQDSFTALGQTVKETVLAKENEEVVEQKSEGGDDVLNSLAGKVDALAESVRLLTTIVSQSETKKSEVTTVRRSIQPTLTMQKDIHQQQAPPKKSITPKLREIIERTT